jgi:hypothetical protein
MACPQGRCCLSSAYYAPTTDFLEPESIRQTPYGVFCCLTIHSGQSAQLLASTWPDMERAQAPGVCVVPPDVDSHAPRNCPHAQACNPCMHHGTCVQIPPRHRPVLVPTPTPCAAQEVERQHTELHAAQMADATAAYALLKKALAAVHSSLSPEALAGIFQWRRAAAADDAESAWRPDVVSFAAPLCTDQEAFARLEGRLAGGEAVLPEDTGAVLHRVQEVLQCTQLTVAALNSFGGSLADSYQHAQADLAAAVDDLRAKLASSQVGAHPRAWRVLRRSFAGLAACAGATNVSA